MIGVRGLWCVVVWCVMFVVGCLLVAGSCCLVFAV